MRTASLAVVLLIIQAGVVLAQDAPPDNPYVIEKVKEQGMYSAWVDGGWKRSVKCIMAELSTTRELKPTEKFFIKAYFYNKNKDLVHTCTRPDQARRGTGADYIGTPTYFKPKKDYDVYFPIPEKIKDGKYKWDNALVVFGDKEKAVAALERKGALDKMSDYAFPEQEIVQKTMEANKGGRRLMR